MQPNIKWIIYFLLFLNLLYYFQEDYTSAQHTLTKDSTIMQWMSNYAATLDDFAWIALIFVYEFETYWMDDDYDNKLVLNGILLVKVIFAILILQTSYAYTVIAFQTPQITEITNAADLCALVGQDLSFLRNLVYTEITPQSCATIPNDGTYFMLPAEPVVTDAAGRIEHINLSITDVFENYSWLLILAMTEMLVRIQNKGRFEGSSIEWAKRLKLGAYGIIVVASIYWITKGHYVYAWDEFTWIAGFAVLDNNLSEWRDELEEAAEHST